MLGRTSFLRKAALLAGFAALAAACTPTFFAGTSLETQSAGGTSVRLIWSAAYDQEFPDVGHSIATYEVRVDGTLVASQPFNVAACRLNGLASNTTYDVEISALSTGLEDSRDIPQVGILSESYTTPAGSDPGGTITCTTETDTDGDRLPDWAETNTGIYVSKRNTGTDPNVADTDGDGLDDGEETVGTSNGLGLNQMGADPLRSTIFLEVDWMDDSQQCAAHSHRPTDAAVNRFIAAFANAPTTNPDGSTGIDMIVDYGQGPPFFNQGRLVGDTIAPIGSINGGVNGTEFNDIKANNFSASREGYFHYALHNHNYNTNSSSSGQAELPGDDLIVSLQCFDSTNNTSNTMMHELGHNLDLRHGGFEDTNGKPNYNSVMNYRYQFPGTDNNCDADGNQVLDYSSDTNLTLNENAVTEAIGVCGAPSIDWNDNAIIDPPYVAQLNLRSNGTTFDNIFEVLEDFDDWSNLSFGSINDADGARVISPEIIDEAPVPLEFQN